MPTAAVPAESICPATGKMTHRTAGAAMRTVEAIRKRSRMRGRHRCGPPAKMSAYRCATCHGYHVGARFTYDTYDHRAG